MANMVLDTTEAYKFANPGHMWYPSAGTFTILAHFAAYMLGFTTFDYHYCQCPY